MKHTFEKECRDFGRCDVYIIAVNSGENAEQKYRFVGELLEAAGPKRFSGKVQDRKLVSCIFAGLGEKTTARSVQTAFGSAMKDAKKHKPEMVGVFVNGDFPEKSVEAVLLAADGFNAHKSQEDEEISFVFYGTEEERVKEGIVLGETVKMARRLVNEPSNVMTPAQLATVARLAGADCGLAVRVYYLPDIERLGM